MVAKPLEIKEKLIVERQNVKVETVIRLHDEDFMKDLYCIMMTMKSPTTSKAVDTIYQRNQRYLAWE